MEIASAFGEDDFADTETVKKVQNKLTNRTLIPLHQIVILIIQTQLTMQI